MKKKKIANIQSKIEVLEKDPHIHTIVISSLHGYVGEVEESMITDTYRCSIEWGNINHGNGKK